MAQYSAKWKEMKQTSERITVNSIDICRLKMKVNRISRNLPFSESVSSNIRTKLQQNCNNIDNAAKKMAKMGKVLENVSDTYMRTECGMGVYAEANVDLEKKLSFNEKLIKYCEAYKNNSLFNLLNSSIVGGAVCGLLCNGVKSFLNSFGNTSSPSGNVESSLLSLDAKLSEGAQIEFKNGKIKELNASISGEVGASILKGEVRGSVGDLSGSASASFVNAKVKGDAGISLYKDGKLSPSMYADLSAKASLLEGEAHGQYGDKDNNIHGKVNGEVLSAEAYAKGNVGVITYKDDNGIEHKTIGAEGKVGAEAYAAKGSVSGGFTLFGIKFDATLTGKAGGAGASASGSVTTNGASGEIGAGLGLGVGLKVGVDWSNFNIKNIFK